MKSKPQQGFDLRDIPCRTLNMPSLEFFRKKRQLTHSRVYLLLILLFRHNLRGIRFCFFGGVLSLVSFFVTDFAYHQSDFCVIGHFCAILFSPSRWTLQNENSKPNEMFEKHTRKIFQFFLLVGPGPWYGIKIHQLLSFCLDFQELVQPAFS